MNYRNALPITILTILVAVLLWPGLQGFARADDKISFEHEWALVELINGAREDPLSAMVSLGMDPDEVIADLPELAEILEEGLPPLNFNDILYQAASGHTNDMLLNDYYSHDSPDGLTFEDRIRESGYDPAVCGETLGMVGFANFISPDDAVEILFENMLRDELNPSRSEERAILNPDFDDIGVAIGAGALTVGGHLFNVYIVTSDFGSVYPPPHLQEDGEKVFLQLMNQARARLPDVVVSLGMDPAELFSALPGLYDLLTTGVPPLGPDEVLGGAARAHTAKMLENSYYGHNSPDGGAYDERIEEAGYDAALTGESLSLLGFDTYIDPVVAAGLMFENMLQYELNSMGEEQSNILDPDLKEVGVGLGVGPLEIGRGERDVYLATADFGARSGEQPLYLTGVVYEDGNGDDLYTPGEGLPSVEITIEPEDTGVAEAGEAVLTDRAGGFAYVAEAGPYRVVARLPGGDEERFVVIGRENAGMEFMVRPVM